MHEDNKINIKFLIKTVQRTLSLVYKQKRIYVLLFFGLSLINAILPFVSLIITQTLINFLQSGINNLNLLIYLFILFSLVSIISTIITNIYNYVGVKLNQFLYYKLNTMLIEKTKYLTLKDYENNETYDLLQRAEQEVGVRPFQIITTVASILSSLISVISSIIILYTWHSWTLFGFIILPFLAFKYFIRINENEYKVLFNRTQYERESWYVSHLLTKDEYIKEIINLNLFKYLFHKFDCLRKKFFKENIKIEKQKSLFTSLYQFSNSIITLFIVYQALSETFFNKIMIGNLTTYINTTEKVETSIRSIVGSIFSLHQSCLYANNIFIFFDYCQEKKKQTLYGKQIGDFQTIELINLSYKYPLRDEYALKDITITLHRGDTIALVGDNGSGKSTLLKILSGMYLDYEGSILIDGTELRDIDQTSLSKKVSVIFQDYNKYQFTVKENIGFGDILDFNNINKIKKSAELANADIFINKLNKKYEQQVGTWFAGGTQLSGGQWQKLAISRLFMNDKASIYILDEPTSSLDIISEHNFFLDFSKNISNSIVIFSTHRFVSAKFSNKILVLDNGKLIECGAHDNLIKKKGKYYKMYNYYLRSYEIIHE